MDALCEVISSSLVEILMVQNLVQLVIHYVFPLVKGDIVKTIGSRFLKEPNAIAVNGDIFYVADTGNRRIAIIDGTKDTLIRSIDCRPYYAQYAGPHEIFTTENLIIVGDVRSQIHHFHKSTGEHLGSFRISGLCSSTEDISLYVANNNMYVLTKNSEGYRFSQHTLHGIFEKYIEIKLDCHDLTYFESVSWERPCRQILINENQIIFFRKNYANIFVHEESQWKDSKKISFSEFSGYGGTHLVKNDQLYSKVLDAPHPEVVKTNRIIVSDLNGVLLHSFTTSKPREYLSGISFTKVDLSLDFICCITIFSQLRLETRSQHTRRVTQA